MRNLIREEADKYQDFFNFMNKEHNLTLTVIEMDEIILEAQKAVNKITSNTMLADSLPCTHAYSKSMNQPFPRKCIRCGEPEKANLR